MFCFFVSQQGNAFAYASPNFQAALDQPHLDALKQVTVFGVPALNIDTCTNTRVSEAALQASCCGLQPKGKRHGNGTLHVSICSLAAVAHGSTCA